MKANLFFLQSDNSFGDSMVMMQCCTHALHDGMILVNCLFPYFLSSTEKNF